MNTDNRLKNVVSISLLVSILFIWVHFLSDKNREGVISNSNARSEKINSPPQIEPISKMLNTDMEPFPLVSNENLVDDLPHEELSSILSAEDRKLVQKANEIYALDEGMVDKSDLSELFLKLQRRYLDTEFTDEKYHILETIWKLAPDIFENPELDVLLQQASYETDDELQKLVLRIEADRDRNVSNTNSRVEVVAKSLIAIESIKHTLAMPEIYPVQPPMEQLNIDEESQENMKNELVSELKDLALYSNDYMEREGSLMLLRNYSPQITADVVKERLFSIQDEDERISYIELLRSMVGDYDSEKLILILESARFDYNPLVAEMASQTIDSINEYEAPVEVESRVTNSIVQEHGDEKIVGLL